MKLLVEIWVLRSVCEVVLETCTLCFKATIKLTKDKKLLLLFPQFINLELLNCSGTWI